MTTSLAARDWRDYAACRATDPDLFFPVAPPNTEAGEHQLAEARAVCGTCPVTAECLRFAFDTRQAHGVWAGTTERERENARLHLTRGTA